MGIMSTCAVLSVQTQRQGLLQCTVYCCRDTSGCECNLQVLQLQWQYAMAVVGLPPQPGGQPSCMLGPNLGHQLALQGLANISHGGSDPRLVSCDTSSSTQGAASPQNHFGHKLSKELKLHGDALT